MYPWIQLWVSVHFDLISLCHFSKSILRCKFSCPLFEAFLHHLKILESIFILGSTQVLDNRTFLQSCFVLKILNFVFSNILYWISSKGYETYFRKTKKETSSNHVFRCYPIAACTFLLRRWYFTMNNLCHAENDRYMVTPH